MKMCAARIEPCLVEALVQPVTPPAVKRGREKMVHRRETGIPVMALAASVAAVVSSSDGVVGAVG